MDLRGSCPFTKLRKSLIYFSSQHASTVYAYVLISSFTHLPLPVLLGISIYNPPLFLAVISLTDQHGRLQKTTTKFFSLPYTSPHAM